MNPRKPIPFEEFVEKQNNFLLHFKEPDNPYTQRKRARPHFKKFAESNPKLENWLTREITKNAPSTAKALEPFNAHLYQAYLKMREHVESDEELFR